VDPLAQNKVSAEFVSPLPSGTVTFLFTDIEGSTERWESNRAGMKQALARHDDVLTASMKPHGGYIFKKMGDAYCVAFHTAPEAIRSAIDAQRMLSVEDFSAVNGLRVRMALHTGYADERDGDYFGPTVNRVARLLAIGHGGQMLVSAAAADLAQGELPGEVSLRSLGGHRLKDLTHPEQIFQIVAAGLAADFPPLRSLDSLPNNLPLQVTSFLGRDEDVTEVRKLLERTRLLTLTGTGGVGKTRLALQVGAELLEQHPDGVWFIDLAGIQDPDLVVSEAATVLGVRVGADRSLSDSIVYALKPKRTLIIVDNCEHLVAAAAQFVSSIVKGAPQVRILATSREALGIAGEMMHRVSTLAVPASSVGITAEKALEYGAVALFVDRATAANTRFVLSDADAPIITDICRSLDGIPFAIELAAARVKLMTVAHLQERLKERFRILTGGDRTALPRQQTMRALVDWSYNLLNERERAVFNRVAVFAGGWTLETASEVCADESIESWEILDLISSLVDKSLVVVEMATKNERYRLLDSTWQYALEKLNETGESERINRRHAEFFLQMAKSAEVTWEVTPTHHWVATLRPELDNFRAALGWALTKKNDVVLGASLESGLSEFWYAQGMSLEGIRWTRLALELDSTIPTATARLWLSLSKFGTGTGSSGTLDAAQQALKHAETLHDEALIAEAWMAIGFAHDRSGDLDEAVAAYTRSAPMLRRVGHKKSLARLLSWWAIVHFVRGDSEAAQKGFTEALGVAKSLADDQIICLVLGNLAELAFQQEDPIKAIAFIEEVLEKRRLNGTSVGNSNTYANLAAYLLAVDNVAEARIAAREAIRYGREHSFPIHVAYAIQHLSVIAAREGLAELGARLLGFVDEVNRGAQVQREPTEQWGFNQLMSALQVHLSNDQIQELVVEGTRLTEDEAIEAALKI